MGIEDEDGVVKSEEEVEEEEEEEYGERWLFSCGVLWRR